jgi:hypothetical protein
MTSSDTPHPAAGSRFSAVHLTPEGWVVLSPWITTKAGDPFRLHCCHCGDDWEAAEHIANQLNTADIK